MNVVKQLPKSIKEMLQPSKFVMFSKTYCPFCDMAKEILHQHSVPYHVANVDEIGIAPEQEKELHTLGKIKTYPNMFIGDKPIGGFQNLRHLHGSGKLFELLKDANIPFEE